MKKSNRKYTVILVDDEPIILRSLKAAVPWEELRLEVIGEARNGEAALDLVMEKSPDIIISDIRMPGKDGIALMKESLLQNAKRIFIVISGYGEFEYAREALRQGAFDYLLKPIDHEELTGMLERAAALLDEQQESDKLLHSVQVLSLLARERMYSEWIEGNERPLQQLQWLNSSELAQDYFMAVVQLDDFLSLSQQWSKEEKRLWLFAVRNILEEWALVNGGLTSFPFHSGEWIVLFPDSLSLRADSLGLDLIHHIKQYTKLACSVGISQRTSGLDQLSGAYQSAMHALFQRFYASGEGVFIDSDSVTVEERVPVAKYPKQLESALIESIRTLNPERMLALLDEVKIYIEEHAFTKEMAARIIVEMTVVLYRQFEIVDWMIDSSPDDLIRSLYKMSSLNEMMAALKDAFKLRMSESLRSPSKEDGPTLVEKAKSYISANYYKDLGVDEVAEYVGLSIGHFCTLFKQMSGFTFLEYLTRCRMEKAKYILKNTSAKVYQIAPMVGYQDPKYFTQVFKKTTGKTPSEFREEAG